MKKTTIRKTRKLISAIHILQDEQLADTSGQAFVTALEERKLKTEQLYRAMALMRYGWDAAHQHWYYRPTRTSLLKTIIRTARKVESTLVDPHDID